jgi:glutamate-1-semialdehyde 2,1-aminomutase
MCAGGGQQWLGITPDLTCLAKALGCGMPIAAIAGKEEVMRGLNPIGPAAVSGTYTGHLIEIMGALAAMEELRTPGFYDRLNALATRLYDGINEIAGRRKVSAVCQGLGARFAIYFGLDDVPITDFRKVVAAFDQDRNREFQRLTLEKGLYFHDYGKSLTPMHHGFTGVHTEHDIDETLTRLDDVFAQLARTSAGPAKMATG